MSRENNVEHKYDDIIHAVYRKSSSRPHMLISDRAAQFSPFSPLSGYGTAISETSRITDRKIELDEYAKAVINEKLKNIVDKVYDANNIKITYFIPDEKKDGGSYEDVFGAVKKVDIYRRTIIMDNGLEILIEDILDIELN